MTLITTFIYSIILSILPVGESSIIPLLIIQENNPINIIIGEEFQIGVNETASLMDEDITIDIYNISDSRCPEGMNCFRAGELEVELVFTHNGKESAITLMTPTWEKGGVSEVKLTDDLTMLLVGPPKKDNSKKPFKVTLVIKK